MYSTIHWQEYQYVWHESMKSVISLTDKMKYDSWMYVIFLTDTCDMMYSCDKMHLHVCHESFAGERASVHASWLRGNTLEHTTTHRNTLQHSAILCDTLQHTVTLCGTLQCLRNGLILQQLKRRTFQKSTRYHYFVHKMTTVLTFEKSYYCICLAWKIDPQKFSKASSIIFWCDKFSSDLKRSKIRVNRASSKVSRPIHMK